MQPLIVIVALLALLPAEVKKQAVLGKKAHVIKDYRACMIHFGRALESKELRPHLRKSLRRLVFGCRKAWTSSLVTKAQARLKAGDLKGSRDLLRRAMIPVLPPMRAGLLKLHDSLEQGPKDGQKTPISPGPARIKEPKTGLELVRIPGGCFAMGTVLLDRMSRRYTDQRPVHHVCLDDFYLGRTEVTAAQYTRCIKTGACRGERFFRRFGELMGKDCNLFHLGRDDHPVNCVSWNGARAYAAWFSKVSGLRCGLPSEAQWEYAARGRGAEVVYPWGDQEPNCKRGIFNAGGAKTGCGKGRTWPVCALPAGNTPQGLCDMGGNVNEYCADGFDPTFYSRSPNKNPRAPTANKKYIVTRGGMWHDTTITLRTSHRKKLQKFMGLSSNGFRIACQK